MRELMKVALPSRFQSRAGLESVCQAFGHQRLRLPELDADVLFPGFSDTPITVSQLPRGSWSTPLADQVHLAKIARVIDAKAILEVGSFRGYTARLLAENTDAGTVIHCVDKAPDHGEAYRGLAIGGRIRRHVGSVEEAIQSSLQDLNFDLIFLDADHSRAAVQHDSSLLLPLLADRGVFVWHDYADWGWMSEWNRVPEVLAELDSTIPLASLPGSSLAVHAKTWLLQDPRPVSHRGHAESDRGADWTTDRLRG